MRIVDAVKGPFHPSPPPLPTFLAQPDSPLPKSVYAPVSATDANIDKEPSDPY